MASRRDRLGPVRPARRCAHRRPGPPLSRSLGDHRDPRSGPGARLPGAASPGRSASRRLHRLRSRPCARAEACAARRATARRGAALALVRPVRAASRRSTPRRLLPDPASAWAGRPRPTIARSDYEKAVAEAKAHIVAGDIYQANLTFAATVRPSAIRSRSTRRSAPGPGAAIALSSSPERTGCSLSRRSCSSRSKTGC